MLPTLFYIEFYKLFRTHDLACTRAHILFIRFLYAILVMLFVNMEAIVKTAILRVNGLSLTAVLAMLNGTLRVSKYFPAKPVSPSELSLHFFLRSICLLFVTRMHLLIHMYFFNFLFNKSTIDDRLTNIIQQKDARVLEIELLINCQTPKYIYLVNKFN